MAKVSVSQAARLAGVSRQHLYKKYINTGAISIEKGVEKFPQIDTSELIRVFGKLIIDSVDNQHGDDNLQEATPVHSNDYMRLQGELKAAKDLLAERDTQLGEAREREQWLRQHVNEVTGALRLLEHKQEPQKRRNWWPF